MSLSLKLHEAIAAVAPIDGISIPNVPAPTAADVAVTFKPEATDQQKTDAQAVLAAFDFVDREPKLVLIGSNTNALLAAGFQYATEDGAGTFTFSATPEAMSSWTAIYIASRDKLISLPIAVSTTDNQIANLTSDTDVQAWYTAAVSAILGIAQAAASLKADVQAAATQADVDAVSTDVAAAVEIVVSPPSPPIIVPPVP